MRKLLALLLFVVSASFAWSQSAYPYAKLIPNDSVTGTTQFTLTKINTSGNAVIMATTDTNGYTGICVENCGTTGSAWIAFAGLVPLIVDGNTTPQHYIQVSGTVAGDGHDTAAVTFPTTGGDVIGRVQQASTGAGAKSMIDLGPNESVAPGVGTTTTIAAGTASMGTGAITSGTCASVVTVGATGVATTDSIFTSPNADPTGVTGYAVSASGSLYIVAFPTTNNVNFKVCNPTSGSLTPAALTMNWRVTR